MSIQDKALIGSGGFAREIMAHLGKFGMPCFVDDEYWEENCKNIHKLSEFDPDKYEVMVAIGDPKIRQSIVNRLPAATRYFSYIHPSSQILAEDVEIGEGSIICAGCIVTTNVKIGKHAHLNLQTTVGHDTQIGDYFTSAPGVKISGNCSIGDCVYLGTNSSVKEKIKIIGFSTVGLNSGVVKPISEPGTYVGTPAKRIK